MSRGGRMGGTRRFPQNELLKEIGSSFYSNQHIEELFPEYNPPVLKKPVYEEKRVVELYKNYLESLKKSEFYLEEPLPPKDVERYSDKYFRSANTKKSLKNAPLVPGFFPDELLPALTKINRTPMSKKLSVQSVDILNSLPKDEEGANEDEEEESEQDAAWEEDDEEENDYMDNYFDNGEGDDLDIDEDDGGNNFS